MLRNSCIQVTSTVRAKRIVLVVPGYCSTAIYSASQAEMQNYELHDRWNLAHSPNSMNGRTFQNRFRSFISNFEHGDKIQDHSFRTQG
jgi:hypothetical protein